MGTAFEVEGQQVGNRWSGGRDRGMQVQVEFTEDQWANMDRTQAVSGDDGSEWESMDAWMADMQATCTVTWMNRFVMNRRARDFDATARRWASQHPDVAHAAASMAQTARNWRG